MDRIVYIGRVTDRKGRTLFRSAPKATRDAAIAECKLARPKAKLCSTSIARVETIKGVQHVIDMHSDIRWHDLRQLAVNDSVA